MSSAIWAWPALTASLGLPGELLDDPARPPRGRMGCEGRPCSQYWASMPGLWGAGGVSPSSPTPGTRIPGPGLLGWCSLCRQEGAFWCGHALLRDASIGHAGAHPGGDAADRCNMVVIWTGPRPQGQPQGKGDGMLIPRRLRSVEITPDHRCACCTTPSRSCRFSSRPFDLPSAVCMLSDQIVDEEVRMRYHSREGQTSSMTTTGLVMSNALSVSTGRSNHCLLPFEGKSGG